VCDGATVHFIPSEDAPVPCCKQRRGPHTWIGDQVLGVHKVQHNNSPAVQLYTCHVKSTSSSKTSCCLRKESPFTCDAAEAGGIVCEIQQRAASRTQHLGPGTIAVISNPKAGLGR
jgi:hypothetical protein